MPEPLEIFCCYAREDQEMLAQLKKHLMPLQRQKLISVWSDASLTAGAEWKKELHNYLENADLILLLISPDFIASDYCYSIEMKRAIERHNLGSTRVIPILLRPIDWGDAPFVSLQMIPTNAIPVSKWPDRDEAFLDITEHIKRFIIQEHLTEQTIPSPHVYVREGLKPTNIRVTSSPSREGNKAIILFDLNGTEHALEYIRYDKITRQTLFLKEKQQELVRLDVPAATLKPVEKQATFHIDGVDGLLTFKMSAFTGIMNISVKVGGVEVFHN